MCAETDWNPDQNVTISYNILAITVCSFQNICGDVKKLPIDYLRYLANIACD